MTPDEQEMIRRRQRDRANVTALVLVAMAILFFAITLVRIGGGHG